MIDENEHRQFRAGLDQFHIFKMEAPEREMNFVQGHTVCPLLCAQCVLLSAQHRLRAWPESARGGRRDTGLGIKNLQFKFPLGHCLAGPWEAHF